MEALRTLLLFLAAWLALSFPIGVAVGYLLGKAADRTCPLCGQFYKDGTQHGSGICADRIETL